MMKKVLALCFIMHYSMVLASEQPSQRAIVIARFPLSVYLHHQLRPDVHLFQRIHLPPHIQYAQVPQAPQMQQAPAARVSEFGVIKKFCCSCLKLIIGYEEADENDANWSN